MVAVGAKSPNCFVPSDSGSFRTSSDRTSRVVEIGEHATEMSRVAVISSVFGFFEIAQFFRQTAQDSWRKEFSIRVSIS